MASEVFNNEVSKVNELFFTSRKTVSDQNNNKATNKNGSETNKTIQSSPLPRDESSSDEEEENQHDKENQDQDVEVVPQVVETEQAVIIESQENEENPEPILEV